MIITFKKQSDNNVQTITAPIFVVIRLSKTIKLAPKFINTPSEFFIFKNLKQKDLSKNASIFVNEDETLLSSYTSGFYLDLLNTDFSLANNELFEIVPNYGLGFLVSTLRVKNSLDQKRNLQDRYDLIV